MNTVTFVLTSAYYTEDSVDFSSYYSVLANQYFSDTVLSLLIIEKGDCNLIILPKSSL